MTSTLTSHDVEEGTLPNGWSRERIADVLTELANGKVLNQGKSPQCEKEPSPSDEVWGVLKTTAIQPGEFLPVHNKRLPSSREPDESIEVASGDLLLTCAGPRVRCGVPCLVRETRPRLMLSGKMYRFRPNEELIGAEFLEGYLLSPGAQEHIEGMKTGTSDSGLNLTHGRFSELPVPIPPLEEQERIVEILEEQLSRLDTALQSVRTVREKAAQFRRSLLHAAFTGALTGHDVEDGELPEGWGQSSLGDISEVRYGYTESANNEPIGPRFLRITDIQNGGVEWEDVPYCEISNQDYQKHRLNNGDIVFARTGATTGKSFLVVDPPDAVCASYLIRLRVKAQFVSQEFLGLYFDSDGYWGQIRKGTTGTAQGGFNASKLSALQVVLPPLEEQERIVEILEDQLSRLDVSLAVAEAVEERSAALRRSLLHSAFTGRLTEEWREAVNV